MSNKLKYKQKEKQYICVECEKSKIMIKPNVLEFVGRNDEVIRRCKHCRKNCIFIPTDEGEF